MPPAIKALRRHQFSALIVPMPDILEDLCSYPAVVDMVPFGSDDTQENKLLTNQTVPNGVLEMSHESIRMLT